MTRARRAVSLVLALLFASAAVVGLVGPAQADSGWVPITGSGSTWSQNALDQWRRNVAANYGMTVNYSGTGSTQGRLDFIAGTVDFGISEIPFQAHPEDLSAPEVPSIGYAYMPIVAGGTSIMYNLKIGGKRVTNLRFSGQTLTKIFTGVITKWNDPAIQADNPGLTMPDKNIVPVIRSDGSGTSAQFTLWMSSQFPQLWQAFCAKVGRANACGMTSQYPVFGSAKAQKGSDGVSGYVSQSYGEGAITYVEYSYARKAGFPVAKLLNAAGYYVEPTAQAVAVALLAARIKSDDPSSPDYLTQDLSQVYTNTDPRVYPMSSYSYMIVPTEVKGIFTADKGRTLGAFANYMICEGQQQADQLGYSPLPMNLVQAGAKQIARIPGAGAVDISTCHNPTFKAGDSPDKNQLALTAPYPQDCDKQGPTQCATGTGGAPTDTNTGGSGSGNGGDNGSGNGDGSGSGGGGGNGSGSSGGNGSGTGGGGSTDAGGGGSTDAGGGDLASTDQSQGVDEFGNVIGGGDGSSGSSGTSNVGAAAVSSPFVLPPAGSGWLTWVMAGAAALFVMIVALPPVLSRRLRSSDRSGAGPHRY